MGDANFNPTSETKKTYADSVSEKIIEAIEEGTAPWMKPWKGEDLYGFMPHNGATGNAYKGINAVNLMIVASIKEYEDPRWLTFNQAKDLDAQVKKGEKGTLIQYWKHSDTVDVLDDKGNKIIGENGKPLRETRKLENPKVFYATVFNAKQIDNMPELKRNDLLLDFNPNQAAENIIQNSGAKITHLAVDRAYYSPSSDAITLPLKEAFISEPEYYSTALHELGHWTGHSSRLDRDLSGSFGSESYAKEELRAEIASFMLSSKIGIDFDPSNHYSYIGSWVKAIEDDKHEIFRASRDAEKISDYIQGLSLQQTQVSDEEISKMNYEHNQSVEDYKTMKQTGEWRSRQFSDFSDLKEYISSLQDEYPKLITLTTPSTTNDSLYSRYLMMNRDDEIKVLHITHEGKQEWIGTHTEDAIYRLNRAHFPHIVKEWGLDRAIAEESKAQKSTLEPEPEKLQTTKQTYLVVPYKEKEAAKAIGCKYDVENKAWYAPKGIDADKIQRYLPDNQEVFIQSSQTIASNVDAMTLFSQELEKRGYQIHGSPVADGRIHRVHLDGDKHGAKNGAYSIYMDAKPSLWMRDWKNSNVADTVITHKESENSHGIDDKLLKQLSEVNRINKIQTQSDRDRMQYAVSKRLEKEFETLSPAIEHAYAKAKEIPPINAKVDERGNLFIPFKDVNDQIQTAQRIPGVSQNDAFPKYFEKGGEKSGNFALVGVDSFKDLKESKPQEIYIAEGYSTAVSVHNALKVPVIVAGDSGNLEPVAKHIAEALKDDKITLVFLADNDLTKKNNPGLNAAYKAANDVKNMMETAAIVVKAQFTQEEKAKGLSDFNDLASSRGTESVKEQITSQVKSQIHIASQKLAQTQVVKSQNEQMQKNKTHTNTYQSHSIAEGMGLSR